MNAVKVDETVSAEIRNVSISFFSVSAFGFEF
jgi:hypothetical protein